jgi:predicted DNA-binding WGR domain protein
LPRVDPRLGTLDMSIMTGMKLVDYRSLRYQDEKSAKFWSIALSGCSHTVNYGRYDTDGQTQTKDFPTEDTARKSYDKLVAEKVKKGYVEDPNVPQELDRRASTLVAAIPTSVTTSTAKIISSPSVQQAKSDIKRAHSIEIPLAIEPKPIELNLERSIDLDPEDWFWSTWRNLEPLPHPEPKPFDLQDCLKRLRKVKVQEHKVFWYWAKAKIDDVLSRAEAHFWFEAIVSTIGYYPIPFSPDELADRLSGQIFDGNVCPENIKIFCKSLNHNPHSYSHEAMILVNLLDLKDLLIADKYIKRKEPILSGLRRFVLPCLSQSQLGELKKFSNYSGLKKVEVFG